jgi:hypothetical protein
MPFNIKDFSSNIDKLGTIQTNKFDIIMNHPPLLQQSIGSFLDSSTLTYRAEQVKVPGAVLETVDNRVYGLGIAKKYPTNVKFTDNSITFIDDRNNSLLKYFYIWMNTIFDFTGDSRLLSSSATYRTEYRENYVTDIQVRIYNQDFKNPTTIAIMKEAYPIFVNDISLDWESNNGLMKIVVGFAFKEWYFKNIQSTASFIAPVNNSVFRLENFVLPERTTTQVKNAIANGVGNAYNYFRSIID